MSQESSVARAARFRSEDVFVDDDNITFESLHLKPEVLQALSSAGFIKPSPIQLRAIPLGRLGNDLIAQAKSGTGKTCVFTVVILESLNLDNLMPQALVLAPTREIAVQIRDVIRTLGKYCHGLEVHAFIGGVPVSMDKQKLNLGCHVVVGTPGRLNQLFSLSAVPSTCIKMVVLDEADQLFTESFRLDIKNILINCLPESNKQVMAFSASFFEEIENEISQYMRDPDWILLDNDTPSLKGVRQYFVNCTTEDDNDNDDDDEENTTDTTKSNPKSEQKLSARLEKIQKQHQLLARKMEILLEIFRKLPFHQCIVFSNNKNRARDVADTLTRNGWPSASISADQPQKERLNSLQKLRDFKIRILVSSDLTSRGIDVDRITLVINLDIPYNAETYLHRVGRTGRFGSIGMAITLVSGKEQIALDRLIKSLQSEISELPPEIPPDYVTSLSYLDKTEEKALSKLETTAANAQKQIEKQSKSENQSLPLPSALIQSMAKTNRQSKPQSEPQLSEPKPKHNTSKSPPKPAMQSTLQHSKNKPPSKEHVLLSHPKKSNKTSQPSKIESGWEAPWPGDWENHDKPVGNGLKKKKNKKPKRAPLNEPIIEEHENNETLTAAAAPAQPMQHNPNVYSYPQGYGYGYGYGYGNYAQGYAQGYAYGPTQQRQSYQNSGVNVEEQYYKDLYAQALKAARAFHAMYG